MGLQAGGVGAAILRALEIGFEVAATEAVREVCPDDRGALGRDRVVLPGGEQGTAGVRRSPQPGTAEICSSAHERQMASTAMPSVIAPGRKTNPPRNSRMICRNGTRTGGFTRVSSVPSTAGPAGHRRPRTFASARVHQGDSSGRNPVLSGSICFDSAGLVLVSYPCASRGTFRAFDRILPMPRFQSVPAITEHALYLRLFLTGGGGW